MRDDEKLDYIKEHVGIYPDFPKEGIIFRDIFASLVDGKACLYLKELLVDHIKQTHPDVDVIVGLESRGFLFNLLLSAELGVGCAPIRKKGKLPGELVSINYSLEYGSDTFEMQKNAIKPNQKVLIVDDLLATGGSLGAAIELVRKAGGNVVECIVIMELEGLQGRKKLDTDIFSLMKF